MRNFSYWPLGRRPVVALGLLLATAGAAQAQLGAATNYPFTGSAQGVSLADINGDGRLDMISANGSTPAAQVFLNTSTPGALPATFAPASAFAFTLSNGYFTTVATGDVNGDGKPDIVAGNPNGNMAVVWLNTTAANATTASFAAGVSFGLPIIPNGVALADINGDGKADLVASGNVQSTAAPVAAVLLSTTATGATTPSFGAVASINGPAGARFAQLAVGDLSGDGKLDLALTDTNNGAAVVLLNATATGATTVAFGTAASFATAANAYGGVAIADFNADGKADLVTANGLNTGNAAVVLLNTTATGAATAAFGPAATATPGGTYSYNVAAGDLNRDGKPDAVVLNGNGSGNGSVGVVLNNTATGATTASLSPGVAYAGINNPNAVAVGDLNGDGKPDVAATNGNIGLAVLLNQYGVPTLTALNPTSGPVGTTVVLTGTNFAAGTTVSFNGTAATSVAVNSTTQLTVVVPTGATSGNVAATTGNGPSNGLPFAIATTATAAPVVTAPANNSATNNLTPTYTGTAPANSTITVYVDNTSSGTTTANGMGAWTLAQPTALSVSSHTVYATAQSSGVAVSPNSATNTFTIDTTAPTVAITSSTASNFGSTTSNPFNYTATFSEAVTGFAASKLTIIGGTLVAGSFVAVSGTTYTFSVAPTTASGYTMVSIAVSQAQDAAGNNNTASNSYYIQYAVTAVTWTGAASTDWSTPGNWTPAAVPSSSATVSIPAGVANQPVAAGNVSASNLTVAAGASLTLAGGPTPGLLTLGSAGFFGPGTPGTLTLGSGSTLAQGAGSKLNINNDLVNNGATFTLDAASSLNFGNSTGGVTHQLRGTAGVTFQTLTVGDQGTADILSILVPVSVRRVVQVLNNAVANVGTGGSLTLLSDAQGTALIVNTSGAVNGPVTVQRYIDGSLNAGPGYRHFGAPVSGATVASLSTGNSFVPVLTQGYNTSATPGTVTPFPNVFGYDQSRLAQVTNNLSAFDKGFYVLNATTTALSSGVGYDVNIAAGQTVSFTGTPYNGDLTRSLSRDADAAAGWQLLANPYPAPLDYSLVAASDRSNLDAAIYVVQSSGQYTGQYRSYINNVGNPVLPVGQGFFVRVSAGQTTGSLAFHNTQRLTAFNTTAFQRSTADLRPQVQLDLAGAGHADAFTAYAEAGATAAFDSQYDAAKLPNSTGLNLASVTGNESLAIDGRAAFTASTTLPLAVGVPAAGTYTLTAAGIANLPAGLDAYLRDAATGQTVKLSIGSSYSFSVTAAQAAATIAGRFTLQFSPQQALAAATALTAAEVSVYPNPAHERFTVLVPGVAAAASVKADLLNTLGQVVRTQAASLPAAGTTLTIETAGLATGIYTLRLQAGASVLARRVVLH